jgi:excisionase family DNA binding protein
MKHSDMMSTGEVANHCGVSQQTAIRWCDRGLLPFHKIPGSKHRRVARKDLQAFIDRNLLAIPQATQDVPAG